MGQEILYCFKCRERIVSADFAAGHAYQVGNNASCSECTTEFLHTLGPKDREILLAKMFKDTQGRQKSSGAAHAAIPERRPPSTQASIVAVRPAPPRSPALPIGIGIAVVVAILIAVMAGRSGPEPAPPEKAAPRVVRPVDHPEARAAVEKARRFAKDRPDDFAGQIQAWDQAVLAAERTPHYEDARRELGALILRRKDAVVRDRVELDDRVRALLAQERFQAAIDHVQSARTRHAVPEWTQAVDQKIRDIRGAAEEIYRTGKEKARRGTAAELEAFRDRIQKWGIPELIADLPVPQERPWTSILGPGLESLRAKGDGGWSFEGGALVKNAASSGAGQTKATVDDAEVRVRFEFRNSTMVWFAVRQAGTLPPHTVSLHALELQSLGAGPHELVFVCKGDAVSASLNGKPVGVKSGTSRSGCVQFNGSAGSELRILSMETRPLN